MSLGLGPAPTLQTFTPTTNEDFIKVSKCCSDYFGPFMDLKQAWAMYSHRERVMWGPQGRKAGLHTPIWTGQDIKGKTLVLTYEQALGEQILFSSMIADLLKMGAKLTLEVEERLLPLFKRSFPEVNVVPWTFPWHPDVYKGDYYCLLGNAGYTLRDKMEKFSREVGYLKAEPVEIPSKLPKVGLSWYSPMVYNEKGKSIPYEALAEITKEHNKSLFCVNLQYGQDKPSNIYSDPNVDLVQDLDKIAGLVSSCDYIVTISNTIAHLAGALGKKTQLLLTEEGLTHWYWKLPWYPNVDVYTKPGYLTWEEVMPVFYNKIKNNA